MAVRANTMVDVDRDRLQEAGATGFGGRNRQRGRVRSSGKGDTEGLSA
jgi:hypothetical protein